MSLEKTLHKIWYNNNGMTVALRPLSWLYCTVVVLRRLAYRLRLFNVHKVDVPVIVVGNITVGGTGKTPLVVYIANLLKHSGYKPGIVSRGYGGKARTWPQQVRPDCDPVMVGDEAILLATRSGCPMSVGPERVAAAEMLLKYTHCDIIISDDGLQHYALGRDLEIAVIDGSRRFGNGHCLPAGPLREPVSRKEKVDFVITNGVATGHEYAMKYQGDTLYQLHDQSVQMPLNDLAGQGAHAIAGIGNPDRFFEQLKIRGLNIIEHPFPDHHPYKPEDLDFGDDLPVVMTEKDAVKIKRFPRENMWYLPIEVEMNNEFEIQLLNLLEKKRHG